MFKMVKATNQLYYVKKKKLWERNKMDQPPQVQNGPSVTAPACGWLPRHDRLQTKQFSFTKKKNAVINW